MADDEHVETMWMDLPIVCPHCGNHGEEDGPWQVNGWTPFRLIEEVVRSWTFEAERRDDGTIHLTADSGSDDVDWESGTNLRFECVQCSGEFPLIENVKVEFE